MEITSLSQLNPNGVYTYADYLSWKIKERLQLIKGMIFPMSAPNRRHQIILGDLHVPFKLHFKNHPCDVYLAPFDVRFPKKGEQNNRQIYTVLQPDICVVCDLTKLDNQGCIGAPDLVIEILSPGNSRREMNFKYEIYEENGVREYWVVHPDDETVEVFVLQEDGRFQIRRTLDESGDKMRSVIFPELEIDLLEIFKPMKGAN